MIPHQVSLSPLSSVSFRSYFFTISQPQSHAGVVNTNTKSWRLPTVPEYPLQTRLPDACITRPGTDLAYYTKFGTAEYLWIWTNIHILTHATCSGEEFGLDHFFCSPHSKDKHHFWNNNNQMKLGRNPNSTMHVHQALLVQ